MARKPRNARTERLTDWRFFFQIYLVSYNFYLFTERLNSYAYKVHGFDDVALCNEHVVPLHV